MNKAIILDRDGVINHDPGDYTYRLEEFHILDGVLDVIRQLSERGYLIIVITNQAGIAKGLYSHAEVGRIHNYLREQAHGVGVEITDIVYCPHHDSTGRCLCRKPGSLLVERALARYNIDPAQSFFVGDKERDIQAGAAAGVPGRQIPVNTSIEFLLEIA